ncbi:MAG: hypothetical protein U0T74_12475 [Chitinophagales bacterium]
MLHRFEWAGKQNARITNYKFWQESNHAIELDAYTPDIFDSKFNYTHDNPVRAGIVDEAKYYLYSSARDYAGLKGLVNIKMID